jgi:hypothetical protein
MISTDSFIDREVIAGDTHFYCNHMSCISLHNAMHEPRIIALMKEKVRIVHLMIARD